MQTQNRGYQQEECRIAMISAHWYANTLSVCGSARQRACKNAYTLVHVASRYVAPDVDMRTRRAIHCALSQPAYIIAMHACIHCPSLRPTLCMRRFPELTSLINFQRNNELTQEFNVHPFIGYICTCPRSRAVFFLVVNSRPTGIGYNITIRLVHQLRN